MSAWRERQRRVSCVFSQRCADAVSNARGGGDRCVPDASAYLRQPRPRASRIRLHRKRRGGPAFLGGEILARLALDRRDELTRLPLVDPPRRLMPPEPFRRAGGKYHPQRAAAERRGRGCRKNARHPRFLHRRIAAAIGPAFAALAERARELGNGRLRRLGRTVHARRVVAHSVECERVALDREAGRSQLVDA